MDSEIAGARRAMRLSTSFVLESLRLLRKATGLEMTTAVVFLQILDATSGLIEELSRREGRFDEASDLPADELREPVSVYVIAHDLEMPYETARRHVQLLIEKGLCRRVGARGVIVPREALARPALLAAVAANAGNAARFADGLRGVDVGRPAVCDAA